MILPFVLKHFNPGDLNKNSINTDVCCHLGIRVLTLEETMFYSCPASLNGYEYYMCVTCC